MLPVGRLRKKSLSLALAFGLAFSISACRMTAKNTEKVKALQAGVVLDEDGNPILQDDPTEESVQDVTLPTLTFTTPGTGAEVTQATNSATFALGGVCDEEGRSVSVKVDGVSAGSATCANSAWSKTIDTTAWTYGTHSIELGLSDAAGNTTTVNATLKRAKAATKLAVGYHHACAIVDTGELQCWGDGGSGQLGFNSTITSASPVKVKELSAAVTQVGAHMNGTCALLSGGTAKCWGQNTYGRVGDNSTTQRNVPTTVLNSAGTSALTGITALVVGQYHACALLGDQTMECWGYNGGAQLGDNTTSNRSLPAKVKNSANTGNLTGITQISAGANHTCALLSNQETVCWGYNVNGQIGNNATATVKLPVSVKDSSGTANLTSISAIEAGLEHTCALMTDATVRCWGRGMYYNLGNNGEAQSNLPVVVQNAQGTGPLSGVASLGKHNGAHTCVVMSASSEVRCWGLNAFGARGSGDMVSLPLPSSVKGVGGSGTLSGVAEIGAGRYFSCALTLDSKVRCWGGATQVQIGHSVSTTVSDPVIMKDESGVTSMTGVTDYSAGNYHVCVVKNGGAYCWGADNWVGSLGNNTWDGTRYPTVVAGMATGVSRVRVNNSGSCFVKSDGTVWCTGYNNYGQLGANIATNVSVKAPVQVLDSSGTAALTGATGINNGYDHICTLHSGLVHCWGRNTDGMLGNNTTIASSVAVRVKNAAGTGDLSGVTQMATGYYHSCVVIGGGVQCWGDNASGQLGINSLMDSKLPVAVPGLSTGVTAVTAGYLHTCALKDDNTLWCWGENGTGQLGDNTVVDRLLPVQVQGLPGGTISEIAGFVNNTCVLIGGAVYCWGYNTANELGASASYSSAHGIPTLVHGMSSSVTKLFDWRMFCGLKSGYLTCWSNGTYFKNQQDNHSFYPIALPDWSN